MVEGIRASIVIEGSMKWDGFLQPLENQVVCHYTCSCLSVTECMQLPLCSPFPGPLNILVMDNACIHCGDEIIELVEHYGTSWVWAVNCWFYGSRCASCLSSTLLSGSQSNQGGLLKDQSMDSMQQWHFLSSNRSDLMYDVEVLNDSHAGVIDTLMLLLMATALMVLV